MKTKKWALTFLVVFTGMILFTAQSALGGSEVSGLPPPTGNAPGTKYEGPLTVFFHDVNETGRSAFEADMYWFLRLRHGSELWSFAGGPAQVSVLGDLLCTDPGCVPVIIGDFFVNTVVPELYPGCAPCPGVDDVVLKSYNRDVDWTVLGDSGGLYYFIADIVIAVQD